MGQAPDAVKHGRRMRSGSKPNLKGMHAFLGIEDDNDDSSDEDFAEQAKEVDKPDNYSFSASDSDDQL
ncbi:hypothetical protein PHYPSEUDO_013659 [Phytophthora pseudosyringae]|uniref:Uncharacterized protein n=1 Tax=Phytophthora pseudosyringae TaxID=221518 RepID=A0A8T1V535_9STRA|nr:hypothetical protein PHYPSEUDO_013659 [Phytophthora pseudosyringae]